VLWEEAKIAITKRWSRGKDGPTNTRKAEGHVPLHPVLACQLMEWHAQTHYAKAMDFIFPSLKAEGRVPLSPAVFVADHLRPAALKAGVQIPDGHRFGLHNLRHSLSHWLVNKAKVEPKVVQTILRHSRIQGPHDTLPTTRTFQSMSLSLVRNIRWKVKNWLSLGNGVIRTNYI
jgi:integrase